MGVCMHVLYTRTAKTLFVVTVIEQMGINK